MAAPQNQPLAAVTRVAELARRRAAAGLDEPDCLVWFGVGRATLERVEAGEIEPGDELAERIDRFLQFTGGDWPQAAAPPSAAPAPPFAHSGGVSGAGDAHQGAAGASSGNAQ